METRTPQKLYAYVDESGQDTLGALFVVATVLTADNQERVRQALERLERASGKGLRKWVKATPRQRLAYMTPVLQLPALHGRLFAAHFTDTTTYVPCILTAITRAVITGAAGQPARATILIDGLQKRDTPNRRRRAPRAASASTDSPGEGPGLKRTERCADASRGRAGGICQAWPGGTS